MRNAFTQLPWTLPACGKLEAAKCHQRTNVESRDAKALACSIKMLQPGVNNNDKEGRGQD